MTLYQALSELPLAADAAGNRMDVFKDRLKITCLFLIEQCDDRLSSGYSEINEILDERIKARHIAEWAESLPADYDLPKAIAEFQKMP